MTTARTPITQRDSPATARKVRNRLTFFVLSLSIMTFHGAVAYGMSSVVNPRLTTDSSIDPSSTDSVIRQIIRPSMSEEEKAIACWRFILDHFYHWYPPQEESVPGDVRDFAKALNSYGYGPCFVNTPLLCALWESAGFESRAWRLGGHTVPEVRYNGKWHMLDADARGWHRAQDGQIASVETLAKNPALFMEPTGRSDPYYPFALPDVVSAPLTPWSQPSRMMDLFQSTENNRILNNRAVTGHPMDLILRPGEKLLLSARNQGSWNQSGRWNLPENMDQTKENALRSGPVDIGGTRRFGNGSLSWQPDLTAKGTLDLLWLGSRNVKVDKKGIVADQAKSEGVAVFRIWSPYVMVDGRIGLQVGVKVGEKPRFDISTDGGYLWTPLSPNNWHAGEGKDRYESEVDIRSFVVGKYEYLLRVHLRETSLTSVNFFTEFQLAPLALPKLKPGRNLVTVFRGADQGHVQLVLGEQQLSEPLYQIKTSGTLLPGRIEPQNIGEPCTVIFKLDTPAPLTAISVGGHLTLEQAENQFIETSYSLDQGRTWQPIWRQTNSSNSEDPEFEIDRRINFASSNRVAKTALIKFTLLRNSPSCTLKGIRLYGFYHTPQSKKARLKVDLIWQERHGTTWTERKLPLIIRRFPQEVELFCDGEEVRMEMILLSPEEKGS